MLNLQDKRSRHATDRVGAMNKLDSTLLDLKLAHKAVEQAREELAKAIHSNFAYERERSEQVQMAVAQAKLAHRHLTEVLERFPEGKGKTSLASADK